MSTVEDPMSQVIEDSVNDAIGDLEPVQTDETPDVEASADADAGDVSAGEVESSEVKSPATRTSEDASASEVNVEDVQEAVDEFAKKFGIAAKSVTGRENRIPYSRVKKIVAKAQADAKAEAEKAFGAKSTPKIAEYETKVKDYEDRLTKVGQFEHILENDPKTFLGMLSQIPAYKPFFDYVNQLAGKAPAEGAKAPEKAAAGLQGDPNDPKPQPNQTMPDGSKVYDLAGLDQLMEWTARQVEKKVAKQVEAQFAPRLAPFEQEQRRREDIARALPVIDQQIAEARTWDRFNELEPKIIEILNSDKRVTLDRAYMRAYQEVIVPKLTSDRNTVRTELMAELKKRPATTSAPNSQQKGKVQDGPRSIEDIIAAEIAKVSG